jgi:hypothetical protein
LRQEQEAKAKIASSTGTKVPWLSRAKAQNL